MTRLDDLATHLAVTVVQYADQAVAAATAEADYRAAHAKRKLRARADGDAKSMTEAETVADADDLVADLHMARLTKAAVADATKERIRSLRASMDAEQTVRADARAADQAAARGWGGGS